MPAAEENPFVPHLAVSVGLLLAFACVGVLIWFLHHIANTINVDRVVALVHSDLSGSLATLPTDDGHVEEQEAKRALVEIAATLRVQESGYLRVLDEGALADWAAGMRADPARFGDARPYARLPAHPARVVDTTGAGDAFNGALAAALALHPQRAFSAQLRFASRYAAASTERAGAAVAMPLLRADG